MSSIEAAILGIIQGLTEFLPISSSAHLVICEQLLKLKEPELFFNLVLHLATVCSVIIVFHKEIYQVLALPRAWILIITSCIPTAIMGFFLFDIVEKSFGSIQVAGGGLLVTGLCLWLTRYVREKKVLLDGFLFSDITFKKAFLIGISQGIALFPGISRSGMTISTALFLKTGRQDAATFSFLLAIPSILGAFGLKLYKMPAIAIEQFPQLAMGFFFAFSVGTIALLYLIRIVREGHFFKFSYYCWFVGIAALLTGYFL